MFYFLSNLSNLFPDADDSTIDNVVSAERSVIGNVLNLVRLVGAGLALVALTWMAISYFTADGRGAPGAVERTADIKGRQLTNFAIGIVVFYGATNILTIVIELISNIITQVVQP